MLLPVCQPSSLVNSTVTSARKDLIKSPVIRAGGLFKLCNTQNCSFIEWKFCKDCNRFFTSEECFNRHKDDTDPAKSLCRALVKCEKCQRVVTRASINDHYCGKVRCSTCQMYFRPENHKCYLQPVKTRKRASEEEESHTNFLDDDVAVENDVQHRQRQNLIFFDFDCTQDHGEHIPNLCVAQNESGEKFVFSGRSTKDKFCKWVFEDKNANTTFVAHNFQAAIPVQKWHHSRDHYPCAKILSLTVPQMTLNSSTVSVSSL